MFGNSWSNLYTKFAVLDHVSFYLWLIRSLLKHCKVPKYYDQDCRSTLLTFLCQGAKVSIDRKTWWDLFTVHWSDSVCSDCKYLCLPNCLMTLWNNRVEVAWATKVCQYCSEIAIPTSSYKHIKSNSKQINLQEWHINCTKLQIFIFTVRHL